MNTEEINYIDLLIHIAKRWRSILACILIMAVLVSGVQYARAVKSANDIKASQALRLSQPTSNEEQKKQAENTIGRLSLSMSDEEIKAVSKVIRLEKEYNQQLKYIQSSLLMTINPYEVSVAKLQYWVDTDYKVNYNGLTDRDKTADIVDAYINRVIDGAWKKEALEKVQSNVSPAYFGEMVSVNDASSSFNITVKYNDEEQLRGIIAVLKQNVEDYKSDVVKNFGQHKLKLVGEAVQVTVDSDIYNLQQNRKNILLNLENNIANYKNTFTDNQKKLYAAEVIVNADENSDQSEETQTAFIITPPTPQLKAKNVILGALLGAVLSCGVYAGMYILSGKMQAEESMNANLDITNLGYIEKEDKAQAVGIFKKIDAWIDGLSRKNYDNLSKEQQIEMAVSNISLYCEKGGMKTIFFNSSSNCSEERTERLKELLEERGFEVKEGFSILQDAKALEDMSRADGVVFLEQVGKSYYEDIRREINLCNEHEKNILGLVVLL